VRAASYAHDRTYGSEPAVVYREEEGEHGNFFPAAWRCIVRNEGWRTRLEKSYTASGRIVRGWERERGELECATSSDALLMNLFCTPGVVGSARLRALLGVETGLHSEHEARFCLMCDARRPDLIEDWFAVLRAVRSSDVRCRLQVVTWQEIARCVPVALRRFLAEKYGIGEDSKIEGDDSYT
jgi:hypothetical protein